MARSASGYPGASIARDLAINIAAAGVYTCLGALWIGYPFWQARLLIAGVAALLTIGAFVANVRALSARIEHLAPEGVDYEDRLNELAASHRGEIFWLTKTSAWADNDEANHGRLKKKKERIATNDLTRLRYILHLGYWRDEIDRTAPESEERRRVANLYLAKLTRLQDNLRDAAACPPEKVQFVVVGPEAGPEPVRIGLYKSLEGRNTVVIFGADTPATKAQLPRFLFGNTPAMARELEKWMDHEWQSRLGQYGVGAATEHDKIRALAMQMLSSEAAFVGRVLGTARRIDDCVIADDMLAHFNSGGLIELVAPQKVTLSGDYNDMRDDGLTVSAALSIEQRAILRLSPTAKAATVTVNGTVVDSDGSFPLLDAFMSRARNEGRPFEAQLEYDQNMSGIGLGSSGAAAVLMAGMLCLLRQRPVTRRDLIGVAYGLESNTPGWECGPQDHAVSVLGGTVAIRYRNREVVSVEELVPAGTLDAISLWKGTTRNARAIIPAVVRRASATQWNAKRIVSEALREGVNGGHWEQILGAVREEAAIQAALSMLTDELKEAIRVATDCGAAAKVSGAGGGGAVVLFDREGRGRGAFESGGRARIACSLGTSGLRVSRLA